MKSLRIIRVCFVFFCLLFFVSCESENSTQQGSSESVHEHVISVDPAVQPTCTREGRTEGSHCALCEETLTAQIPIPATGHSVVIDEAVAATCTDSGKTAGAHCGLCSQILVTQRETALSGHIVETDDAIAPTCTKEGKTEGSHCKRCGTVLLAQEVLPIHHTYDQKLVHSEFLAANATNCDSEAYFFSCTCGKKGTETFFKEVSVSFYLNDSLYEVRTTGKEQQYQVSPPSISNTVSYDSRTASYFYGWFSDPYYEAPLSETTIFTENTQVYGKLLISTLSYFTYEVDAGEATITGYLDNEATDLVIPSHINSFPVKAIQAKAFENNTLLRYVVMDDSLTEIQTYAFSGCNSIEYLALPNSLTRIGLRAFYNCTSLENIEIPKSLLEVGFSAFENCTNLHAVHIADITAWCQIEWEDMTSNPCAYAEKLYLGDTLITEAAIPDDILVILDYAFYANSSLTKLTIGKQVTSIGKLAFDGCENLTDIYYTGSEAEWNAIKKGSYWNRDTGAYTLHYNYVPYH